MTNKEAIRRILDHKRVHSLDEPRAVLINEALDLAIKALEERPQGEWVDEGQYADYQSAHAYICKNCGYQIIENPSMIFENRFCKYCGADMRQRK